MVEKKPSEDSLYDCYYYSVPPSPSPPHITYLGEQRLLELVLFLHHFHTVSWHQQTLHSVRV